MATQMELPFVTLDVFTSTRFKGNPLAVVTIPAGTKPYPTQEQKQIIAREFNLSETVFIHEEHPDVDSKDKSTRRIDIFITTAELPFAGHPTIGAAVSLLDKGITTLITKAGPIPLQQPEPNTIQAAIPFNVHLHKKTLSALSAGQPNFFAPGDLSVIPEIQAAELAAPIFSIVNGMAFILIELPTVELLSKVTGSAASFPVDQTLDPGWRGGFLGRYYFVRVSQGPDTVAIRSRMIEKSFEDPATGSAACALSSYLTLAAGDAELNRTVRYQITQGVEIDRESNILVTIGTKEGKIDQVNLAGTAVQVMRGHVTL